VRRSIEISRATAVAACLLLAACNSTNPVAPDPQQPPGGGPGAGSYSISLSADPVQLVAGATEPTVVTVAATRTDNGQPAPSGTRCALSTNLGSFDVARALTLTTVTLDAAGTAHASLYPSATTGTATILAQIDTSLRQLSIPIREADRTFFVTSVTPSFGSSDGGTAVRITGAGFGAQGTPIRVTFGGITAPNAHVLADGSLEATTPPPPSHVPVGETLAVDVVVTKGTNPPLTDTLQGGFIYDNDGADNQPRVTAVIPDNGPNAGGTSVVLRGNGFVPPVEVFFGFARNQGTFDGAAASVVAESESQITVIAPDATRAPVAMTDRTVDIRVRNLDTGAVTVAYGAYTYGGDFYVSDISATSGPYTGGTVVTITGKGFQAPVEVRFGGVAQRATSVTSTSITVTTAAVSVTGCNPPSGPVSVTNLASARTATSALTFTYTAPIPQLTSITPSTGGQAGGTQLTIRGSGFDSAVRVELGGVPSQSVTVAADRASVAATAPAFTGTFTTEACDDNHDGQQGVRNLPSAVDVRVTNSATGCADTLTRAYTYTPSDATCRNDAGTGGTLPDANFTFRNSNFVSGAVDFLDTSSGNPTQWTWDFDDPTSGSQNVSQDQSPTHTFLGGNRTYHVRLTVRNATGSDSVTKNVTIPLP
jgi:hypothetical protein